ncbi:hypothetical protein [Streptomyces sp. NPDC021224]|uniref:hypothetical protein n=1 Tax=unclassified Streptomyces TaxID=2593676 RepID=UPI0037A52B13
MAIWTLSPGRSTGSGADPRRVAVAVRAGLPGRSSGSARAFTSRYIEEWAGSFTCPGPWVALRICSVSSMICRMLVLARPRRRRSASSTAAATRSSPRPRPAVWRMERLSTTPHSPRLR